MSSFDSDKFRHSLFYLDVLRNIERRNWNDFDYHRNEFTPTLNKIKRIKWIEVDKEKYNKVFKAESDVLYDDYSVCNILLRSSRYSHYSLSKCYPNSRTCQECYKYFCPCCDSGTNCMYGEKCLDKRCLTTIDKYYKDICKVETESQNVFVYSYEDSFDFLNNKKQSVCQREIYGY